MTTKLLILLLIGWATSGLAQQFGNLVYPAAGNIQFDEGTVELWIVSGFDADNAKSGAVSLFDIVHPVEGWHYIINFINWGGALAMVGYVQPQQSYVWSEKVHWKPGEAHHLAWTWSGRRRSLFVDGRVGKGEPGRGALQGEGREDTSENVRVEGGLHGDLTKTQLMIGRGHSLITIDEVRISSIARPIEEIRKRKDAVPTRDTYTLLLDHCDGGPAEAIAEFTGEKGGTLSGSYKVVESRFGKAIQLWKDQ